MAHNLKFRYGSIIEKDRLGLGHYVLSIDVHVRMKHLKGCRSRLRVLAISGRPDHF